MQLRIPAMIICSITARICRECVGGERDRVTSEVQLKE